MAVIVPTHRPTMQVKFGLTMSKLLEYLTVLRRLLWEGSADVDGAHFRPLGRETTSHQETARC